MFVEMNWIFFVVWNLKRSIIFNWAADSPDF